MTTIIRLQLFFTENSHILYHYSEIMDIISISILVLCGISVNLMSALFGIGGGVLMVPLLRTLFPDFPIQVVAACSLTIVMGTAMINLLQFRREAIKIKRKNVFIWSISMMIGVQLGFELSFTLSSFMITGLFSAVLLLLALKTLYQKKTIQEENQPTTLKDLNYGILSCGFGGWIAGITGIGGGSIMAPLVSQIKSVQPKQVAIYTNYMMVIGGFGNLFGYLSRHPEQPLLHFPDWQVGYVNFAIVGIVVVSSFLASFLTMKLRGYLSPELTNKLLGIILLIIAVYSFALNYWYA